MVRVHSFPHVCVVECPNHRVCNHCGGITGQGKSVLSVVAYVSHDLLREPASERPTCRVGSSPASARRLACRSIVSVQPAEAEVGRQELVRGVVLGCAERTHPLIIYTV